MIFLKNWRRSDSTCDLRYICTSVGRLLLRLRDNFDKKPVSSFAKQCEYLNYWIYYIIKDSLKCENISSFYKTLDGIKLSFIPEGHSCDIQNFGTDKEEFLTKRTLFFHAEILDWIINEYDGINNSDRVYYNQYLGEAYNFYKEIICKNDSTLKKNCSKELKKFRETFNVTIDFLKTRNISITQENLPSNNESLCLIKSPTNKGELSQARSDLPGTLGPLGVVALTDQGSRDQGINGNPSEEVRTNKEGTIASSLAGSCFFLGMMYKFTPMGSWINTKVLGRNKLMDNMEKNHYELLLNGVGNREMSLNDTMYHIRYNSAAN
ncbi:PIR protein [Plasmodium vivax]|uniref:VIR protein n=1 Tax=Plasmodium vivax TaxID=5855 RepID=A0A565A4X8_PLAVI|nr:PIR protein [Plasmodium vivax]